MNPSALTFAAPPPEVIRFACWSCNTELTVPAHMAGVTGPCPRCGQVLAAPVGLPDAMRVQEFEPAQREPEPYSVRPPPLPGSAHPGGSQGYRTPDLRFSSLPSSSSKGMSQDELMMRIMAMLFAIPALGIGDSMLLHALLAGLFAGVGAFLGRVLLMFENRFLRYGCAVVLCLAFVVGSKEFGSMKDLPQLTGRKSTSSGGIAGSNGEKMKQVAEFRAFTMEQNPGLFTDDDLTAAAAAVLSSSQQDMKGRAQVYAAALKTRLEGR